jgi:hypothetical protein
MSQFVADKKINLNGAEYTLKFNFKTILNFEKATGKNFFKLGGDFSGTDIITLLWAMLISGGHTIDIEKTAEIVDFSNIGEINKIINELVKSGMPEDKEQNYKEQSSKEHSSKESSDGDNAYGDGGNDPLGNNSPLEEKLRN